MASGPVTGPSMMLASIASAADGETTSDKVRSTISAEVLVELGMEALGLYLKKM